MGQLSSESVQPFCIQISSQILFYTSMTIKGNVLTPSATLIRSSLSLTVLLPASFLTLNLGPYYSKLVFYVLAGGIYLLRHHRRVRLRSRQPARSTCEMSYQIKPSTNQQQSTIQKLITILGVTLSMPAIDNTEKRYKRR